MSHSHQATSLTIADRRPKRMGRASRLDDFTWTAGDVFDARGLLDNPNISLYCLDDAGRQAIFVELPPGVDLARTPFYYLVQFEQAERLIAVPYETFHQIAADFPLPDQLILVHNIGRCGSTLLHHAFNELDTVVSLSEPDALGNIISMRRGNEQRDPELIELMHSCVRVLFRTWSPSDITAVIKFRSQGVTIIDLVYAAFPQAYHLFMYRNALGWITSIYRLVTRHQEPSVFSRAEAVELMQDYVIVSAVDVEPLFNPHTETVSLVEFLTIEWVHMLLHYQGRALGNVPLVTFRYDELTAQPRPMLEALFRHCNLPLSGVDTALPAFSRDSQEGTRLAQESAGSGSAPLLDDAQIAQIEAVLRRRPEIQTSDYRLPGTLEP